MKEKRSPRRVAAELLESNTIFWTVVLRYKILYLQALLTKTSKPKTVLFYPEKPKPFHVLYKIFHILGYKITTDLNIKADLVIHFNDTTTRELDPVLVNLGRQQKVVNINCNDISKKNVDKVFESVFGYGSIIDPATYSGKCVKKSDDNAKHDGVIIECPAEPEKGFVYQKIINNQDGDIVLDLRAPVINNKIPFVYKKYRSASRRFENINISVAMVPVEEVFTPQEVKNILAFSKQFGLDYGELDILRDNGDGKLYIVDVNNTPSGPPNHIPKDQYKLAINEIARTFQAEFLSQS